MDRLYKTYYKSEIGVIEITGTEEGILSVEFVENSLAEDAPPDGEVPLCLQDCVRQLDEYFKGKRKEFDLSLILRGTEFQMKVWQKLKEIPYGKTVSYRDVAEAVGNPKAVRAVGGANNKNKICIIIPCHRVIGKDGSMVGYGSGLWRKEWLLKHEKSNM